ncbi:4Fe-4S binding protein [Chloroflexota bacterium]
MDAYQVLAEKHGYGDSQRYRRILEFLITPQEAELVTYLPDTFKEVASKMGLSVDEVKKVIDKLFRRGVVIPKDLHTLEGARFCREILQFHDATEADQKTEEFYGERAAEFWGLWEDFAKNEWYAKRAEDFAQRERGHERVIPAYPAIQDIPGITPYDDVREIIKAASLIAMVPCSCRRQSRRKDIPVDVCTMLGRGAEYAIVRGSGRQVSHEEALKVIDETEEDGEVHTWTNRRTLDYGVLCHCDSVSCVLWAPSIQHGVPMEKGLEKSRFEAVIDQELCSGCQVCVDRCQFDAIEMVKPADSKKFKAVVDPDKCWGCGMCVIKCEPAALSLKLVRPLEHIPVGKQT